MKRGVFLDRDGVVLKLTRHFRNELYDVSELRLLPGAARAIALLNKAGVLVFIHTNQAVIARGRLTEEKLHTIHNALNERLQKQGARIDAFYYCPHHPEGVVEQYAIRCACRKPKIGLIRKATREFGIDIKKSFMVGDSTRDIMTGTRAGLKTILVKTGNAGNDGMYAVKPDRIVKNILEAARVIQKEKARSRSVKS